MSENQPISRQSPEIDRAGATLAARAGVDASPAQIAVATVAIWVEIKTVLTPIIGSRGVAALYRRTIHLSATRHPCFVPLKEMNAEILDASALESVLAQQSEVQALASSVDLLKTFQQLLATLIGASLTERLLRPVWTSPLSGSSAQDITP